MDPADFVSNKIFLRYSHPSRTAYTYMFRLKPGSDLGTMTPDVNLVLAAWVDEGDGLTPALPEIAVEHCRAAEQHKPELSDPRTMTAHLRRQMMARAIQFTAEQTREDLVEVNLVSRSVCFSPKGDRQAHEEWKPGGEGWFSAHVPRD